MVSSVTTSIGSFAATGSSMTGSRLLTIKHNYFLVSLRNRIKSHYFFCFFVAVDARIVVLAAASRASLDERARLGVMPKTPTSVDCVNCCSASYDAFMLALRRPCCILIENKNKKRKQTFYWENTIQYK